MSVTPHDPTECPLCKPLCVMALSIADACAPETIITASMPVDLDGETWYDTNTPSDLIDDITVRDFFDEEFVYSEARNLLRIHPTQPNMVQIATVSA